MGREHRLSGLNGQVPKGKGGKEAGWVGQRRVAGGIPHHTRSL